MNGTSAPARRLDLAEQRILFVCPRFFSYENDIADELRSRGAQVDLMPDRPFASPLFHVVARIWRRAVLPVTDRHYRRLLKGFASGRYDHVFVINGQTLSRRLLQELRKTNPNARFTLYMWDSLANRRGALELLPLFDRTFSFEPSARRYGFLLRPLFFSSAFSSAEPTGTAYAISFIGTMHTDRYPIVKRIDSDLPPDMPRFWYLYVKARWVLSALRFARRDYADAREHEFRFVPLSRAESSRIFWQSRAVLDIEHPRQEGLTMRTLEALGAGKKLVTTNRNITQYRLYDPARICVVERDNPTIPVEFLATDAPALPPELHKIYSLAGWVDEVLGTRQDAPSHIDNDEP